MQVQAQEPHVRHRRLSPGGAGSSLGRASGCRSRRDLARDSRYDLHALVDLVARGCLPELAARILAPLEKQRRRMKVTTLPAVEVVQQSTPPIGASRVGLRRGVSGLVERPAFRRLQQGSGRRPPACASSQARRVSRSPAGDRALPHIRGDEIDDIALEAADDALMSVLRRLDDFRGASGFTTWAYKLPSWRRRSSSESARGRGER